MEGGGCSLTPLAMPFIQFVIVKLMYGSAPHALETKQSPRRYRLRSMNDLGMVVRGYRHDVTRPNVGVL